MKTTERFDVIVVGSGPGGTVAAKRCAQRGFKTLLLEKKKLPRDKVCTGMVMGPWAHNIIQKEFGNIPPEVLVAPYYLSGYTIHVPQAKMQVIKNFTPIAWRKDLDFWMTKKAKDAGVKISDESKVIKIVQDRGQYRVTYKKEKETRELTATFIIGADGAASTVRKSLFPGLRVRYSAPVRECYQGALDIEREYCHWFFPRCRPRPRFDLNHKEDFFMIEGSGIRELGEEIRRLLGNYGFDPKSKPLWKDGCLEPLLHSELISGVFSPAERNILLVGDAAGLILPITFEGIGVALKSGLLAADSIAEGAMLSREASQIYLRKLKPVLQVIGTLYSLHVNLEKNGAAGPLKFSKALESAYEKTLRIM